MRTNQDSTYILLWPLATPNDLLGRLKLIDDDVIHKQEHLDCESQFFPACYIATSPVFPSSIPAYCFFPVIHRNDDPLP